MLMTTEMKNIGHMKGGNDETSYAKASYIQKQVLSLTKPITKKALKEFYEKEQPATTIIIADMGCSSAEQNTLNLYTELIDTIDNARRELGNNNNGGLDYQLYLNDLPGNDFNTLFRSLGSFKQKTKDDFGHYCFVNGVPGSFYERLFPSNHLHFVHSNYSLHWLSQVPKGIENNKRNVHIGSTSPSNVGKAFYDQYENDFSKFLRCRSKEVTQGGIMVLTMMGRKSSQLYNKESYCRMFDLLATTLNDMVNEGLIEEEKLNSFNMPMYFPSSTELGYWVEKEGSFNLNEIVISEVNWKATKEDGSSSSSNNNNNNNNNNSNSSSNNKSYDHDDFAKCMRAVAEPFIVNHFGEAILEDMYLRIKEFIKVAMAKEMKNAFTNLTICLTQKKTQ